MKYNYFLFFVFINSFSDKIANVMSDFMITQRFPKECSQIVYLY